MKKLALIRFGNSPSQAVSMALRPHIVGKGFVAPIPGAILSVFNSESSIEEVSESIKETGALFILTDYDESQFNMPEGFTEAVEAVIGQTPQTPQVEITLDDVLDLINRNGIESLTPEQRRILESFQ